jgi:hypothetical protein
VTIGEVNVDVPRLAVVVDTLIPADDAPGAIATGADRYVLAQLLGESAADAAMVGDGLDRIGDIAATPEYERAAALARFEDEPFFARLVELAHEGFYSDPANGGNDGAASWQMLGYSSRVPGRP